MIIRFMIKWALMDTENNVGLGIRETPKLMKDITAVTRKPIAADLQRQPEMQSFTK